MRYPPRPPPRGLSFVIDHAVNIAKHVGFLWDPPITDVSAGPIKSRFLTNTGF